MLIEYGKSYKQVEKIKSQFNEENDIWLNEMNRIREIYIRQPKRTVCKICSEHLGGVLVLPAIVLNMNCVNAVVI